MIFVKNKSVLYYLATALVFFLLLTPSVYAVCPLGEDVTKDLYGVLKIFQIAAPILCIAFSTLDVVKTVAKGDAEAEMKKVATKFGKRMIYTVLLFFLPILVDQAMQIADVWGVDGACDLTAPENNGQENNGGSQSNNTTKQTRTTTENCAAITNKESCDRDQKCTWDNSTNTCKLLDWR